MATEPAGVSDMTATVKSREVQRAMFAEMAGDPTAAARHFLAAAHLELVLADDYTAAGMADLALRSRLSAASCFWRGGQVLQAESVFSDLRREHPDQAAQIDSVRADLAQHHPAQAS